MVIVVFTPAAIICPCTVYQFIAVSKTTTIFFCDNKIIISPKRS